MDKSRHAKIIEIMENENVISVKELARLLDVTEMTIRRNLDDLQDLGFIRREHGYAVLLHAGKQTDYYVESSEHAEEKKAIARAALQYIKPMMSICIDSGTTTQAMIEMIPQQISLSVITPSLVGGLALADHKHINILLPEGFMHHSNRSILLSNPSSLKNYKADVAFISCRSFKPPYGAYELTPTLTETKQALAGIADKNILLADYSKWDVNSLCTSIPMDHLDIIITDNKAPRPLVQECIAAKKGIILADPEDESKNEYFNIH